MENETTMESVLGSRVRRLREARGLTQREVAEQMAERGFDWRQATVAKTEGAGRPIRVNETYALARVFDVSVTSLLMDPDSAHVHELLVAADNTRVAESRRDEAKAHLERCQAELVRANRFFQELESRG